MSHLTFHDVLVHFSSEEIFESIFKFKINVNFVSIFEVFFVNFGPIFEISMESKQYSNFESVLCITSNRRKTGFWISVH